MHVHGNNKDDENDYSNKAIILKQRPLYTPASIYIT